MKTRFPSVTPLMAILANPVSMAEFSPAQTPNPSVPTETLTASPSQVQAGTYPILTWSITHPNTLVDVVTIDPDGTITPKENLYLDIRILGASYQISSTLYGTVESYVKADGATSFTRFFQGTQNQINPATNYHTQSVRSAVPSISAPAVTMARAG